MFRWGILSTAKIAREHLIPAIQQSTNGNVQAIASRTPERAAELAKRFQIPQVDKDYDALLANPEVDGIYIPLPNSDHAPWAIKAAQAGKHVLVEKPLAANADAIREVIDARDQTGVLISEAFMVTYHPQWAKVRDLLADGAIGPLVHVQAAFSFFNRDPENTRNQSGLDGGALPDIGVYPIVTTRFATGEEPVRARSSIRFDPDFGVDVYTRAELEFQSFGMSFYCSTQLALEQRIVFHGENGRIVLQAPFNAGLFDFDQVSLHDQGNEEIQSFRFSRVNQYRLEVEAFVRAAADRSAPHFSLESSFANQAVLDAIFAADKSGGWVDVARI